MTADALFVAKLPAEGDLVRASSVFNLRGNVSHQTRRASIDELTAQVPCALKAFKNSGSLGAAASISYFSSSPSLCASATSAITSKKVRRNSKRCLRAAPQRQRKATHMCPRRGDAPTQRTPLTRWQVQYEPRGYCARQYQPQHARPEHEKREEQAGEGHGWQTWWTLQTE